MSDISALGVEKIPCICDLGKTEKYFWPILTYVEFHLIGYFWIKLSYSKTFAHFTQDQFSRLQKQHIKYSKGIR